MSKSESSRRPGLSVWHVLTTVLAAWSCDATPPTAPSASSQPLYVANGYPQHVNVYAAGAAGDVAPTATIGHPLTGLTGPVAVARDGAGRLYVYYRGGDSIAVYAAGATGEAAPVAAMPGRARSPLVRPGLAVDSARNLYVTNYSDTIAVYATGGGGPIPPPATIAGPRTGLHTAARVAVDRAGRIYVYNVDKRVTIYAAGARGDVAPIDSIAGPNTQFGSGDIAVDTAGRVYVSVRQSIYDYYQSIAVYAAGASGNAAPAASFTVWNLAGMAVDRAGRVYVAKSGIPRITIYASNATGTFSAVDSIMGNRTALDTATGMAIDSAGQIAVANEFENSVLVFAAGATGNATPTATIWAITTGLASPYGIARDAAGRLYVADRGRPGRITIYPAGATGNTPPVARLAGSHTGLRHLEGIAIDAAGQLYVANRTHGNHTTSFYNHTYSDSNSSITVYAPGATGDAPPTATIAGPNTQLFDPYLLAFDRTGRLYVTNLDSGFTLTVYPPGATGNVAPVATRRFWDPQRPNTPIALGLDAADRLYVTSAGVDSRRIEIFQLTAGGTLTRADSIVGPNTGLYDAGGVAFDAAGRLYVVNYFGTDASHILIFAPGATGNVAPAAVIKGPNTGLSSAVTVTF